MSAETQTDQRESHVFGNIQQGTATVGGALLAVAGLAGFLLPGDELIVFGVNLLHNSFHLLSGLLGIAAGTMAAGAYADEFNQAMGVIYGGLIVFQLVAPELAFQLLHADAADLWLHVALTALFGGVGFLIERR